MADAHRLNTLGMTISPDTDHRLNVDGMVILAADAILRFTLEPLAARFATSSLGDRFTVEPLDGRFPERSLTP